MENRRIAVILMNLGGPNNLDAVRPFLFNLFYDRSIINLPNPFRWLLASFISTRREDTAKLIYSQIGGKSPILEETNLQANTLERELNEDSQEDGCIYKVFTAMRYWHPFTSEIIPDVKKYNPSNVILLPLYPQFSTTTTLSSIKEWKKNNITVPTNTVCCYMNDQLFIEAHAEILGEYYKKASNIGNTIILFSAHGLPQKIVDGGDPYQWQIEQSCKAIIEKLKFEHVDWKICYQSKVGPLSWLKPSTHQEIINAGKDNKIVVIVPISFVSEHSETLVELDIEYKDLAYKHGVKEYFRVPALGTNNNFIACLKKLCKESSKPSTVARSRVCPPNFEKCFCNFE